MVGLQTLDLAIGVRVPASQPNLDTKCERSLTACLLITGLWRQVVAYQRVDEDYCT